MPTTRQTVVMPFPDIALVREDRIVSPQAVAWKNGTALYYAHASWPSTEEPRVGKCINCGAENDDASVRCVCGQALLQDAGMTPASTTDTEAIPPEAAPASEPRLILRKILFVFGTLAVVALYGLFRHRLKTSPLNSSLVVTGVFCAAAVAGLWFLGRDRRLMLRVWRIAFLVRSVYLLPLILNIVDGLMEFGWPSGRFNRPIARILTLVIPLAALAFLTGLLAHIRTYRVAGVLAMLSGVTSIVLGVYLIPATKSLPPSIALGDILNNVMFVARLERYAAIPMGVVFVLGGMLTLMAFLARARK